MPNNKNVALLEELKKKVSLAKSMVFADYHGLKSNQANDLRQKMKEVGGEMSISKNSLLKIALKEKNLLSKEANEVLDGPVATFFAYDDAIAAIKLLADFAKKITLPKIRGAVVDGLFANASKVEILSQLPSRDQLIAKVVGGLKSPLTGFVNVIGGTRRNLVYVLSAIADKKKNQN
ncbi:50S ribosomal protein L10 [candidate division WWE3 bacterium]|nr:50S ribosomal protein L10 [candidate division WWE3 bacterium]